MGLKDKEEQKTPNPSTPGEESKFDAFADKRS